MPPSIPFASREGELEIMEGFLILESRKCAPRAHADDRRHPPCSRGLNGVDAMEATPRKDGLHALVTIYWPGAHVRRGEDHRNQIIPRECGGPRHARNSHHGVSGGEVITGRLSALRGNRVPAAMRQALPHPRDGFTSWQVMQSRADNVIMETPAAAATSTLKRHG